MTSKQQDTSLMYQRIRHCALCDKSGPESMFEQFNQSGGLACKSTTLCMLRQEGKDPAALLGQLMREMTPAELSVLDTRQLAELAYDLRGELSETLGGFAGAVRIHLSGRADSGKAVEAVEADRRARRRRQAALRAAGTRARRLREAAERVSTT